MLGDTENELLPTRGTHEHMRARKYRIPITMNLNRPALGLAAIGIVSQASVVQAAEHEQLAALQTTLPATTISGYVDTSAEWNFGAGTANLPPYRFNSPNKVDGFNLDVIQLRIDKPLDESDWAAGYRADLWFGPDANALNTTSTGANTSDFAVRQAYVALRAPVGTGLDLKLGVFDSIIGYESIESDVDPNFTRSYGNTIEPTTFTGLLGSYRFSDVVAASAGIANTTGPSINGRAFPTPPNDGGNMAESFKTYMVSLTLTAPQSCGWAAGTSLQFGWVNGFFSTGPGAGFTQSSWYVGGMIPTGVTGLTVGLAWDYKEYRDSPLDDWALAGYGSYQATQKLSLHGRLDYFNSGEGAGSLKNFALTGTVQYDLWKNVLSRLELRWDHSGNGVDQFGGTIPGEPDSKNAWMLALNIIYRF